MLSKFKKIGLSLVLGASISYGAAISDVQPFVEKAYKLCQEKGNEACFKEFNNTKGEFVKGELYIFAYKFDGELLALGSNPQIVGRNLFKIKDKNGAYIIQDLSKLAQTKGEGWYDYQWSHPNTKKVTPKTSFIKRIDGNMFIGSGIYK